MSILHLPRVLPDGRSVAYHVPTEFSFDAAACRMRIIVSSYELEAAARNRAAAAAKSIVEIPLPGWAPVYADNLINFVTADPEWVGAAVLP